LQEAWTVSGLELTWTLLKSPTILGIIALVWVIILATLFLKRGSRIKQLIKLTVALIATLAVVAGISYSFRPGTQYGLVVKDENVIVTFFENKKITFNICNSEINLVNRTSAINLLHLRKMGVYDPSTGIASGYFLTQNGTTIYAIITGKNINQVLLIRDANHTAIIGVPNIENAFRVLTGIQDECHK
jgi:hypothetical protein